MNELGEAESGIAVILTYYGVLALFPALIALVSVLGLVGDPATGEVARPGKDLDHYLAVLEQGWRGLFEQLDERADDVHVFGNTPKLPRETGVCLSRGDPDLGECAFPPGRQARQEAEASFAAAEAAGAERLVTILPPLTREQALESLAVRSVLGAVPATGIDLVPPFVAPCWESGSICSSGSDAGASCGSAAPPSGSSATTSLNQSRRSRSLPSMPRRSVIADAAQPLHAPLIRTLMTPSCTSTSSSSPPWPSMYGRISSSASSASIRSSIGARPYIDSSASATG